MNIIMQKTVKPDVVYKLSIFNGQDYTLQSAQGYVGFSKDEDICIVYVKFKGNGQVNNHGQYAFRIKGDMLQYFQNGWLDFDESAQKEFQMSEADQILLGDEE